MKRLKVLLLSKLNDIHVLEFGKRVDIERGSIAHNRTTYYTTLSSKKRKVDKLMANALVINHQHISGIKIYVYKMIFETLTFSGHFILYVLISHNNKFGFREVCGKYSPR